jgi:hypothetical protein
MKTKIVILKNLYTGELVHTHAYDEVDTVKGVEFIQVFKPENPERKYYVNRSAFQIVTK